MLDKVELKLKAGDGGKGAVTFRREKYVPFGGPFGGDGGSGGDVIIKAEAGVSTLRAYKHRRSFRAENGRGGMTKNKHGSNGANLVLTVPPGTLIYMRNEAGDPELIADLEEEGQEKVVARGGNGGYGNIHFATSTNQVPRIAQPGISGQEKSIILELRLIADVGIIGYPNVGKSSLLAAISAAHPKIADYPFTTLEPELGVVSVGSNSFILAEIPGLIEGAYTGKGLGHSFLRHAMRTKVLLHLLDGSSVSPLNDMVSVNNELAKFDATLAKRPQIIAINKIDLPTVASRVDKLKADFAEAGMNPVFISAAAGIGLKALAEEIWSLLKVSEVRLKFAPETQVPVKVFHPKPVDRAAKVHKKGNSYILAEPAVERLLDKCDRQDPAGLERFNESLEKMGINKLLRASGANSGDTVITGNIEWTWIDDEQNRRHGRHI